MTLHEQQPTRHEEHDLVKAGAEAGEEGRGQRTGAVCVRLRLQTFQEGGPLMGVHQRNDLIRLTYSIACYISTEQKTSNFIRDTDLKKCRFLTFQQPTPKYPDALMH